MHNEEGWWVVVVIRTYTGDRACVREELSDVEVRHSLAQISHGEA